MQKRRLADIIAVLDTVAGSCSVSDNAGEAELWPITRRMISAILY